MVQIGNIHFGKASSSVQPQVDIIEASLLWDLMVARYNCVEETQIYNYYAHDVELKALLNFGIGFLESQVNELEKQLNLYKIPLPKRPPKSVNNGVDNMVLSDQFMFSQVFEGCQNFIDYLAHISRSIISNDPLRHLIVKSLTDELSLFDKLIKFAKLKGWLEVPPIYRPE